MEDVKELVELIDRSESTATVSILVLMEDVKELHIIVPILF